MVKSISQVKVEDFRVEPPMKMKNGAGHLCKFDSPELQFPRMQIPWNTAVKTGLNNGPPACKLALKFNSFKDSLEGSQGRLAALLDNLDDMAVDYIVKNKKALFGNKAKSEAVIRETFTRSVKEDPNQKYTPTFSAKLDFDRRQDTKRVRMDNPDDLSHSHVMRIGCFTRDGKPLVAEEVLAKDSEIQPIVTPRHIWVTANGMGITYNASRCVVHKTGGTQTNFDFDLDEIEPEQEGDGVVVTGPPTTDGDEDEDADEAAGVLDD